MKKRKICMGCFTAWDEKRESCAFCGWRPEKEREREGTWHTGKILEKRFLLGGIYRKTDRDIIWRAYDGMLGERVFLMTWGRRAEDQPPKHKLDESEPGEEQATNVKSEPGEEQTANVKSAPGEEQTANAKSALREEQTADAASASDGGFQLLCLRRAAGRNVLLFSLENKYLPPEEFRLPGNVLNLGQSVIRNIYLSGKTEKGLLPKDFLLDGRYQIVGPLGIGGFGITYLCVDINLGRNVAVKEYFPEQWAEREESFVSVKSSQVLQAFQYGKKMFCREIKMTAKFIHSRQIVTVYDAFYENDTVYMVMEYLDGESVGRELQSRQKGLGSQETKEIAEQTLAALTQLHRRKIVHGDLSPGNVIRTKSGRIVLIDLGAAKYFYDRNMTFQAVFLKPDYAAPEQYQAAREGKGGREGPWTDFYALGVFLYQCLTGTKPYDAVTRLETDRGSRIFPRRFGKPIGRRWKRIIRECLELEREKRPSNAELLLEEVQAI